MNPSQVDVNGNLSQCIQYANSVGGTLYYNICNNTTHWVPWGSGDWVMVTLIGLFIAAVVSLAIFVIRNC